MPPPPCSAHRGRRGPGVPVYSFPHVPTEAAGTWAGGCLGIALFVLWGLERNLVTRDRIRFPKKKMGVRGKGTVARGQERMRNSRGGGGWRGSPSASQFPVSWLTSLGLPAKEMGSITLPCQAHGTEGGAAVSSL